MSLNTVRCSWDVFHACLTHALSTEHEEIMGLLLGEWAYGADGRAEIASIVDIFICARSDRRKDRVEISEPQLAEAADEAERITARTGRPIRVVGWYHSHPHITVFPSHVDVRTQGQWQALDSGFIGLIFSVFNDDPRDRSGKVLVTAFQSSGSAAAGWARRDVPLKLGLGPGGAASASASTSTSASGPAMHSVPDSGEGSSALLQRLVGMQRTLCAEERALFADAVMDAAAEAGGDGAGDGANAPAAAASHHGLCVAHASAVYQQALCELLETCTLPLKQHVQQQLEHLEGTKLPDLRTQNEQLLARIAELEQRGGR